VHRPTYYGGCRQLAVNADTCASVHVHARCGLAELAASILNDTAKADQLPLLSGNLAVIAQ
jgi:hypothetical protein